VARPAPWPSVSPEKGPAGSEGATTENWTDYLMRLQGFECTYLPQPKELLMYKILLRFIKDESGATAIEYGLIAAGISVAIIAVVKGTGTNLKTTFGSVQTALK
jgi:pilus assembly protein Flp/PilA